MELAGEANIRTSHHVDTLQELQASNEPVALLITANSNQPTLMKTSFLAEEDLSSTDDGSRASSEAIYTPSPGDSTGLSPGPIDKSGALRAPPDVTERPQKPRLINAQAGFPFLIRTLFAMTVLMRNSAFVMR